MGLAAKGLYKLRSTIYQDVYSVTFYLISVMYCTSLNPVFWFSLYVFPKSHCVYIYIYIYIYGLDSGGHDSSGLTV